MVVCFALLPYILPITCLFGDKMPITYVRTMKIKYADNKLTDLQMAKLCKDLQDNGLNVVDWGYGDVKTYGELTSTEDTTIYTIVNSRNKIVYGGKYCSVRDEVFDQIKMVYKVTKSSYVDSVTKTEWVQPYGNRLSLVETDAEIKPYYDYNYEYDNEVIMKVTYFNDYSGIGIDFEITWVSDKIQRKETIEEMVVETPLSDMGKIQSIFENALADYTEVAEYPQIDCHFDAKTESRSECTPDIIKQVRDARRNTDE